MMKVARRGRSQRALNWRKVVVSVFGILGLALIGVVLFYSIWFIKVVEVRSSHSQLTVEDGESFEVPAFAVNRAGKRLERTLSFMVEGESVEQLEERRFRCMKGGQSSVTAALDENRWVEVNVNCSVVDRVVPPVGPLILAVGSPRRLEVKAYSGEKEVVDAAIEMTSSGPAVVGIDHGVLVPHSVGRAVIHVESGLGRASVAVDVGERILDETFRLSDGGSADWGLLPGHHVVEVQAHADNGGKSGVTLIWNGAFCPGQGESQLHRVTCPVEREAFLRVTNPGSPFGVPVSVYLRVTRIP